MRGQWEYVARPDLVANARHCRSSCCVDALQSCVILPDTVTIPLFATLHDLALLLCDAVIWAYGIACHSKYYMNTYIYLAAFWPNVHHVKCQSWKYCKQLQIDLQLF